MPSNILKSLVAVALVASPTIGSTQVGAEVDRETSSMNRDEALGPLFALAVFAVVLLVYAGQNGDQDDDGQNVPVSP